METQENQLELYDSLIRYRDKRSKVLPDVAAAGDALRDAVYKEGALSTKVKRMIAMAVALGIGCMPCIIGQTKQAVDAGATAAKQGGELVAVHVIARPHDAVEKLLPKGINATPPVVD